MSNSLLYTHSGYPFFLKEGEEALEAGSVRVSAVVAHKRTVFKTGTIPVLTCIFPKEEKSGITTCLLDLPKKNVLATMASSTQSKKLGGLS